MKLTKGFTLIEIILAIAIIALISFGSYAGFQKFSKQQNLNLTMDTLRNSLNEAKSKAMSQVIVTSACKQATRTLEGYQVRFDASTNPDQYYYIEEVCSGVAAQTVKTIKLPPNVSFRTSPPPPSLVRFLILTGLTNGPATITLISGTQTKAITVDSSGRIHDEP